MTNLQVVEIQKCEIEPWLLYKHYAHKIPAVVKQFGLFKDGFLEGVCCYGSPACPSNNYMGDFKQYELVRLVVNEGLPKNSLSFFVSGTFKYLEGPLSLVSYADSLHGHHGYIYQATNWIYTGQSDCVYRWINEEGKDLHNRAMTEYRKKFPKLTVTEIATKLGYKKVLGSSKFRYFYFIGNKRDKRIWLKELKKRYTIMPYPKGENQRYKIEKDKTRVVDLMNY